MRRSLSHSSSRTYLGSTRVNFFHIFSVLLLSLVHVGRSFYVPPTTDINVQSGLSVRVATRVVGKALQKAREHIIRRHGRSIALHKVAQEAGTDIGLQMSSVRHPQESNWLSSIVPNDLWAVHDLLLTGYGAVFMKKESHGMREAQVAALALAELLPDVHPHAPCRTQIAEAIEGSDDEMTRIVAAANAAWDCLPAKFSSASFSSAYEDHYIGNFEAAKATRMPRLHDPSVLGACKGTKWPRTCSMWASLHTMALRADALGLGQKLFQSTLPLLAAGATLCGGCTMHVRALHEGVLSPGIANDLGEVF